MFEPAASAEASGSTGPGRRQTVVRLYVDGQLVATPSVATSRTGEFIGRLIAMGYREISPDTD